MRLFIAKIISLFISDKDRKKEIRKKYDKFYQVRRSSIVRDIELGNFTGFYPNIYLRPISYDFALDKGHVKNKKEHLENINKLKENLEPQALAWLEKYLSFQNRLSKGEVLRQYDIFDKSELHVYEQSLAVKNQILKHKDYYSWGKYKLPVNLFETSVFMFKHGVCNLKTFDKVFTEGSDNVIIDAGAYVLDSALAFRDVTNAEIHSFEPTKESYEQGLETIKLNNLKNIISVNEGLGDKEGECKVCASNEYNLGSNFLDYSNTDKTSFKTSEYNIKINTIDNYVEKNNLNVGMIKVDVEGFELPLLKGALETIKSQKPIILLSIYHNYNDFYKLKPWLDKLDLGYKFDFFKGIENHPYDVMLLCEVR
jgi:FkbM family methyltransferase